MGLFGGDGRSSATNTTTLDFNFSPVINAITGYGNNPTGTPSNVFSPKGYNTSDASGTDTGSLPISYAEGGNASTSEQTGPSGSGGGGGIAPLLAWMALNDPGGGAGAPLYAGDYPS